MKGTTKPVCTELGNWSISSSRCDASPPPTDPIFWPCFYYSVVSETKLVTDGNNISTEIFKKFSYFFFKYQSFLKSGFFQGYWRGVTCVYPYDSILTTSLRIQGLFLRLIKVWSKNCTITESLRNFKKSIFFPTLLIILISLVIITYYILR